MGTALFAALMLAAVSAPLSAQSLRETVDFTLDSGRELTAEIRRPAQTRQPLPAVLLFGGFRGAATVLDAVPQDVPVAAVSFDYPFDPPRKFVFPDTLMHIPAMARGIDETFEGIEHLVAHLRAREDIDDKRITIVGASLGAPFAVISAANLELPGLVIVHGFGEVRRVIATQFIRKFEPRYGKWVRWPSWGLANALVWGFGLPAPERSAPKLGSEQRAMMIVAGDDEMIPQRATETLWQALQASQARVERINEQGVHLQGTGDPRIADLVGTSLDWMRRNDLQ